jgi:hypothetical protein
MRYMLYMTVPASLLMMSCSTLPFILKDAELGVEAIDVALEAEEGFVEKVNKGNDDATR